MADVVYNFVGGIPYSVLYDSVRLAIRKSRKFRTHLVDLQLTLDSLEPRIIQQIGENFVELNLPNDIIEDLKTKMREGKELVDLLVELSVWNIRIWGNFCNCIGPDYAQQLIQLNRSLRILIDQLSLQDTRMLTEVLKELRKSNHDRDDMQKRLLKIESVNVEMLDLLKKQGIGRTESSNVQAIASSSGGGGTSVPYPALGVVFQQLCDVIIQAKVKNMMCKRLLQVFKLTLNCLQPLIEELEEYNEVFHLSEQQLMNLTGRIKNGVELVHKCTKVRKRANYIKFEKIRNNILDLNKFLQRLFLQLKCQAERNVKEAMASTREIEAGIKDIEGRGVLQIYELGRKGQSSGQGGQPPGPGDVIIRETVLVGSACVTEDQEVQPNEEETDYLVPQMETEGSPRVETFESESATRKMEVGVKETDEKSDEEEKNLHVWDNTILNCVPAVPTKRRMDESKRPAWYTPEPDLQDIQPLSYEDDHSYRSNKIPASPLHVPPSPRYSNSPRLCKLGSVHLTLSQIARATRNFSKSQLIGEGAFGTVYKARLADGQMVSIERAEKEFFKDLQTEFSSEVELLAEFDHRNLVKLLGYVNEGDERLIITEYVPNGNLREHLDCKYKKTLEFNQRLEIAIDIAHALTYLHLCSEKQIIHRDVKSSNILLTESMRAKVANFGFARLGPMDTDRTHISTKVKRTVGYLDPEYMKTYQLTPKSDVYSFGILLIEIMTGRCPVELKRPLVERVTLKWAFKKLSEGGVVDLIDPVMKERVDGQVLFKIFDLAIHCAAPIRADRPDMKTVGEQLWTIRADYLKSLKRG